MEYRLIRRESRNDVIERILTKNEEEKMESDLLFPEEVLVKNDTLVLKDYRIAAP